jgi:hypothetical protein
MTTLFVASALGVLSVVLLRLLHAVAGWGVKA